VPLRVTVSLTPDPPACTDSVPPLDTVVVLAVPPLSTTSALPVVTTAPELTAPEDTNCVVMQDALSPERRMPPSSARKKLNAMAGN
jgi:hypothetical protein